jgi:shikimate dehydrogenase
VAEPLISGRTDVLAILGDPIRQVRTPELVNAEIARRGLDAVLVPLHVRPSGLAEVLAALRRTGNVRGAVVTMPHKQAAAGLVDHLSPTAREVGACNVVRFDEDGTIRGELTDGSALTTALTAAGAALAGARVFLAGAGGAASAIAYAVADQGAAALALCNRTRGRASALAEGIRARYPGVDVEVCDPRPGTADVVVNATSVGIDPEHRDLPFDASALTARTVVADIVISPRPTALVEAARAAAAAVVDGEDMLRAQVGAFVDFMLPDPSTATPSDRPNGRETGLHRV